MNAYWRNLAPELKGAVAELLRHEDLLSLSCTCRQMAVLLYPKLKAFKFLNHLVNLKRKEALFILRHSPKIDWNIQVGNQSVLHIAAGLACKDSLELLLTLPYHRRCLDVGDHEGWTPLHLAAMWNDEEAVSCLLDRGANANSRCSAHNTALHYASLRGRKAMVQLLVEAKAEISCLSKTHASALYLACLWNHSSVANMLISLGCDCNSQCQGSSCLSWAVRFKNVNLTRTLLQGGAEVDYQDLHGWTPLMFAVEGSSLEIVKLLLASGATVLSENRCGDTALSLALKCGNDQLIDLVQSALPYNF